MIKRNSVAFVSVFLLFANTDGVLAQDSIVYNVDIHNAGGLITVPVLHEGQRFEFILDTGTGVNIFDTTLLPLLEPTSDLAQMGETIFPMYKSRSMFVGQTSMPLTGLGFCRDLTRLRKSSGRPIRGIVGMEFLRHYVFQLDFDEGKLRFLRDRGPRAGQRIPLTIDNYRCPTIQVELPGLGATAFVVDTGMSNCSNGHLSETVIARLAERGDFKVDSMTTRTGDLDKAMRPRQGTLSRLSVGMFQHVDQTFIEGTRNTLGLGYLTRYLVTFDHPGGAIYLAKGKNFNKRFPLDHMGWKLSRRDGRIEVDEVDRGGLAEKHGIHKGDRILEIDGKRAIDIPPFEVELLAAGSPDGLTLTIQETASAAARRIHVVDDINP